MFAQIAGGKNPGPGGPPNNWLRTLRDDLADFRSTEGSTEDSSRQFHTAVGAVMEYKQNNANRSEHVLKKTKMQASISDYLQQNRRIKK